MNSPSVEAAVVPASVEAGIESTVELSKPTDHLSQEEWFDIEYGRYVLEDRPLPALEEDGLALVTQD
jgi:hypothetical protein